MFGLLKSIGYCFSIGVLAVFVATASAGEIAIESGLANFQVFQRNESDRASLEVSGSSSVEGSVLARISDETKALEGFDALPIGLATGGTWKGTIPEVPLGGPYTIEVGVVDSAGKTLAQISVSNVLVGDLWLLAGQSNMQGIGNMIDVEAPSDRVNVYRMRHEWDNAKEPIHRLYESPDPVHLGGKPQKTREESDKTASEHPKGAGLGLPFAKEMVARTGVPIGLVPTAHGGTSMDQWNPDLRDKGGESLYGSMLKSLHAVGGKVKGVLWYQGESDAGSAETAQAFPEKLVRLVDAFRTDVGNPELPFYHVQIGTFVYDKAFPPGWDAVQEHQRVLESTVPNCGAVASVDLALDDLIHIGTPDLKVIGHRLANLAIGESARGPRLEGIERFDGGLRVVYREVNGTLLPEGRVSGYSVHNATGEQLPLLYRQKVDPTKPNTVLLYLAKEPPAGSLLYYGHGLAPFCNLRDEENMGALAFGPVVIPE